MYSWNKLDRPLILASASPRRKEILEKMGFDFTVLIPDIKDENLFIQSDRIDESIQELAYAKAESIAAQHVSSLVFSSDTVVVLGNKIIGKPVDYADAKSMLLSLSGKTHKVYSSIALICENMHFNQTAVACTNVFFRDVPESEIDDYLTSDEYADKAGAYAIQGSAMTFVNKIDGCFYNVMGLPVSETIAIFKAYFDFLKGSL
jgi:septum formation protein